MEYALRVDAKASAVYGEAIVLILVVMEYALRAMASGANLYVVMS